MRLPKLRRQSPTPGSPRSGWVRKVAIFAGLAVLVLVLVYAVPPLLRSAVRASIGPIPDGDATANVPELTGTPFVSASPEAPPPKLRDVKPVSVVGPTWQKGDETRTFAIRGIPFAFRGGEHWGCWQLGDGTTIDGHGWRCVNKEADRNGPQLDILIRRCDGECDQREQHKLDTDWLGRKVDYQRRDPTTQYAEGSTQGKYALVVSHFFPDKPGGKLHWQVAMDCESLTTDRTELQKVVNDIRTQSG